MISWWPIAVAQGIGMRGRSEGAEAQAGYCDMKGKGKFIVAGLVAAAAALWLLWAMPRPVAAQLSCGVRPELSDDLAQRLERKVESLLARRLVAAEVASVVLPELTALAEKLSPRAAPAERSKIRAFLFNATCFRLLLGQGNWEGARAAHIRQLRQLLAAPAGGPQPSDVAAGRQRAADMTRSATRKAPRPVASGEAGKKLEDRLGPQSGATGETEDTALAGDWHEKVVGRLKRVKLTLSHPKKIAVGASGPVIVSLQAERKVTLPGAGALRLGHALAVSVQGEDFLVSPAGRQIKVLSAQGRESWHFSITPKRVGQNRPFLVRLEVMPPASNPAARPVLVRTLRREIEVSESWWRQWLASIKGWFAGAWGAKAVP